MIKKIILPLSIAIIVFSGCEKKDETTKKVESVQDVTKVAPKIEIVKNENANEIKVKEVENKDDRSYYYSYNVKSNYDTNSKPANDDAGVREKPRTQIDANLHVRTPYENVEVSMLVKKLSKDFIVKCSACHNDYANGIIGPSLLGKDSDFIFNAITQFKTGKKKNVLMKELISMMDDKEIRSLADEINQFNKQIQKLRK